jgi:cyclic-di-GMP-binding protein
MPSFDIVSEVECQEVNNALDQARKELSTRFDFKGSKARLDLSKPDLIELYADDASHLKALQEIIIGKMAKRSIDLRNVDRGEPAISPLGHARQEIRIKQGLEGDKAKEIIKAIKELDFKVQSQLQDRQIRVTGKKRDELQKVIQILRNRDFGVGLNFRNFRD